MAEIKILQETQNGFYWQGYPLKAGFEENWVLDKTTDTANAVSFEAGTKPSLDIGQWVLLLPESSEPTYTGDLLPDNHTQYIIGGFTVEEQPTLSLWTVSLSLIEPIEIFKGVVGEVLTFTSQTEKKAYFPDTGITKTYIKEPYNHLAALERWLKLTPANCDPLNQSWFGKIKMTEATKAFLRNIPFGDKTLNARNLYELLLDVYDSSTGRTPVAYFDIDTTGLPAFGKQSYILEFEKQNGADKAVIPFTEFVQGASRITTTKSIANYGTGTVCDSENMSVLDNLAYPSKGMYVVPEFDSNERELKGKTATQTDNWILRVPIAIKKITKAIKVTMSAKEEFFVTSSYSVKSNKVDVTEFVYEEKEYNALVPDPQGNAEILKYRSGGNIVVLRGFKGTQESNSSAVNDTIIYYIEYQPLLPARLLSGDNDKGGYSIPISQVDSQVDSVGQFKFMNNYTNSLNKADIIVCKTYGKYAEFKDLIGSRVINDGVEYLITCQSYKNRNNMYDVFYQLNIEHFRKSDKYEAVGEIQKNIAIGYENIIERKIAMKERVSIGTVQSFYRGQNYGLWLPSAISALFPSYNFAGAILCPQVALIVSKSVLAKEGGGTDNFETYNLAPLAKFTFGNQIGLHYTFLNNAESGKSKESLTRSYPNTPQTGAVTTQYIDRPYTQLPNLYTDYFGEIQTQDVYFTQVMGTDFEEGENTYATSASLNDFVKKYNRIKALPKLTQAEADLAKADKVLWVEDRVVLKDQQETLNENYIVELYGEDCIVTNEVARLSRLMQPYDTHYLRIMLLNRKIAEGEPIEVGDIVYNKILTLASDGWFGGSNAELKYTFAAYGDNDYESIVIATGHATEPSKPLIIVNDLQAVHRLRIANGEFYVFASFNSK